MKPVLTFLPSWFSSLMPLTLGPFGGIEVRVRLRKDAVLELRLAFVPRLSFRRASKFLSRLGIRGLEGTWT